MALNKRCLRILLLVYNVVFAVCGFVLFFLNSIILYQMAKYDSFLKTESIMSAVSLVVIGLACIIFSKFGWSVTYKQNRLHMIAVTSVLVVLVLCNVGVFVWIMKILHNLKHTVTAEVETAFTRATAEKNEKFIKIWDNVQNQLSCCGVGGPTDYRTSQTVPWSCCMRSYGPNAMGDCSSVHQQGCLLNVYDTTREYLLYAALSSLAMALIEIVGVVSFVFMVKGLGSATTTENRSPGRAQDSTRGLLAHMRPQKY